ncbi:hypothetical protein [Actinoplanes sp. N902-109]|uniref:hypothetical protein n=1 Tax=Actinoplanes sp. (strain N902-109) TaxID=649831 RepID=UPI00032937E3|nr:hypothetical protein [Actinoplanes sp. N902-109]AGL18794.1 hypothetical protein L083_5284 [Actinoplanes sp. N902-109]
MTAWDRWAARLPTATLLNFLAGLLAGTGINLLTSSAVGDAGGLRAVTVADSVAWVLSAGLLTVAATALQNSELAAALYIKPDFDEEEQRATRMVKRHPIARRSVLLTTGAVAMALLAFALLPFLADGDADRAPASKPTGPASPSPR